MKRRIEAAAGAWAAALVATVASPLADAQTTASPAAAAVGAAYTAPIFGLMQGLFGLAIVVALIFAAGWVMKKIGPRARTHSVVQVIGGASVGPREKVVVVRFGTQTLLLGVAPGHVGLLHAADPAEPVDADASTAPSPETPRFIDRLRTARSRG